MKNYDEFDLIESEHEWDIVKQLMIGVSVLFVIMILLACHYSL